jgi:hypothetical protein
VLRVQGFAVPASFAAPPQTTVPVHQLVAVWASMLGAPPPMPQPDSRCVRQLAT